MSKFVKDDRFHFTDRYGCARALHWWRVLFRAQRELNQLGIEDRDIVEQLVPEMASDTVLILAAVIPKEDDDEQRPPTVN